MDGSTTGTCFHELAIRSELKAVFASWHKGSFAIEMESVFIWAGGRHVCEFERGRYNRCQRNLLFFGKTQQGVNFLVVD